MTNKKLTRAEYDQVARLHVEYIGAGFLSSLGTNFLSLLYRSIDESEQSTLILHTQDDRVVGFVSAAESLRPVYKKLLQHPFSLLWALLPVLSSLEKVRKIAELLFRTSNNMDAMRDYSGEPELLSIVVEEQYQGTGIAQGLYDNLRRCYLDRERAGFLIVVGAKLYAAQKFYSKCGAVPVGTVQLHKGEDSILFWQSLSGKSD